MPSTSNIKNGRKPQIFWPVQIFGLICVVLNSSLRTLSLKWLLSFVFVSGETDFMFLEKMQTMPWLIRAKQLSQNIHDVHRTFYNVNKNTNSYLAYCLAVCSDLLQYLQSNLNAYLPCLFPWLTGGITDSCMLPMGRKKTLLSEFITSSDE